MTKVQGSGFQVSGSKSQGTDYRFLFQFPVIRHLIPENRSQYPVTSAGQLVASGQYPVPCTQHRETRNPDNCVFLRSARRDQIIHDLANNAKRKTKCAVRTTKITPPPISASHCLPAPHRQFYSQSTHHKKSENRVYRSRDLFHFV